MSLLKTEEQARLSAASALGAKQGAEAARDQTITLKGETEDLREEVLLAQAETEIARDEALNYGEARIERSWAALAAVTGMAADDTAHVVSTDEGTHTDPVIGGTVNNAGVFKYSASPAGWERIADLQGQIATTQADRAFLQSFLGNQPFADETELEAYTNALLEVSDRTITRDGGVYVLTVADPPTWVREDDSDGEKARAAAAEIEASVADIDSLKERLPAPFAIKPLFHAVYSYAFVDSNNYPIALIERDGGKWLLPLSDDTRISMSGITSEPISRFSGFLWPWVDSARNLIGGIEKDGSLLTRLSERSIVPAGAVQTAVAALLASTRMGIPSGRVYFSGDSLTAGAGGGGTTYPGVMAAALGLAYVTTAVGGTLSGSIGVRQGGIAMNLTLAADLPADTSEVDVSSYSAEFTNNQGGYSNVAGTLDGERVILRRYSSPSPNEATTLKYTIRRAAAGEARTIPAGTRFMADLFEGNELDIHYIQAGQNDSRSTRAQRIVVRDNILRMVDRIGHDRFGVLGLKYNSVAATTADSTAGMNQMLEDALGWHFIKTYEYLGSQAALDDAGIVATPDDVTAVTAGAVPPSLRSDSVHGNASYYTLEGNFMARWHRGHGFPIGI